MNERNVKDMRDQKLVNALSASHRNARGNCVTMGRKCPDCRREFWMQEVE